MQKSSIPAKYLLPWAQHDTSKVEVPVTTTDPTRASLSLGFPPLTEQPPEVGGVPPQGEDFNGGMNQISRAIWWMMQGGGFPYDSAFASASQIGGYINSAVIPRADGAGFWLSTADNNLTNPDATDGTAANWVPLNVYGTGTINVTATTVTVYPVTAAFPVLLISGTLTANTVINLPAWTYQWKIVDNTVRAGFTLTLKTATGAGVVIQTGSQDVRGDGTNIVQNPQSIAPATLTSQAVTLSQVQTDSLNYGVAGGTADALTATLPAGVTALTDGFPVTVKLAFANATTTPTLAITIGTTAIGALTIVKGANAALAAGDLPGAGAEAEFTYNSTNNNWVLKNPATGVTNATVAQVQAVGASVASNALTMTYTPVGSLSWRNPTLTNGIPVSLTAAAIGTQSITVPSGASLGTVASQQSQLVLLEAYNAGSPVLCVANLAGGLDLSETNLISPTTISSGATSANVIYSASAVAANSPYRVVGVITMPGQTTAGTWATDHTAAQGIGGMAYAAMQSVGFGQTWNIYTSTTRAIGTTYYNTTGRPISVFMSASGTPPSVTVNGINIGSNLAGSTPINFIVPPGGAYFVSGATWQYWSELR